MRFARWLAAREHAVDEDEPSSKYKPSEECKSDVQKQGARAIGDLVLLDQSLLLGRPAGKGVAWWMRSMVCLQVRVKGQGRSQVFEYGAETFATEVKAAKKLQNAQLLKTFVLQSCNSLLGSDHQFASDGGIVEDHAMVHEGIEGNGKVGQHGSRLLRRGKRAFLSWPRAA
eukprot:1888367-Prymnesium_polylepis.2